MEMSNETRLLLAVIVKLQNHVLMLQELTQHALGEIVAMRGSDMKGIIGDIESGYSRSVLKQEDFLRDVMTKIDEGEPPMTIEDFLKDR